jgi:hypothetical protein
VRVILCYNTTWKMIVGNWTFGWWLVGFVGGFRKVEEGEERGKTECPCLPLISIYLTGVVISGIFYKILRPFNLDSRVLTCQTTMAPSKPVVLKSVTFPGAPSG